MKNQKYKNTKEYASNVKSCNNNNNDVQMMVVNNEFSNVKDRTFGDAQLEPKSNEIEDKKINNVQEITNGIIHENVNKKNSKEATRSSETAMEPNVHFPQHGSHESTDFTSNPNVIQSNLTKITDANAIEDLRVTHQIKSNKSSKTQCILATARNFILTILQMISISSVRNLTTTNAAMHKITIKPNTEPIRQKQRKIPFNYQTEFDALLNDMLASGKIRPSTSGWASPLRLLRKKDGSLRITVDYQMVNNVTEKVAYPLPLVDDIFSRLANARYFTVIDLTSGYYQVPLHPDSIKYTAFICARGLFEYQVLPMGITNATETFQRMMNQVLKGLLYTICEVYLDDIIIYSNTIEEHIEHVKQVVNRLNEYNLKIKLEKCKIAEQQIEYLSHVISHGTISPSPAKVADLMKYNPPLNAKQTHSFIGLGSYYRKFIEKFAHIVAPLREALQEKVFKWDQKCTDAFNTLRSKLTSEKVLSLPDFSKPFQIETDACRYGIGGVISQQKDNQWHPVAYYSKHLNTTEQNYSTTERELYAMVMTAEHFKQFLYGTEFVIVTDHQPLKYVMNLKEPNARLMRWISRLSQFKFQIQYRKGNDNGNADALSRMPTDPENHEDEGSNHPIILNALEIQTTNHDNNQDQITQLNEDQASDENLKWMYNLKIQARTENKHRVKVKRFQNQEQKSLYTQWNRLQLINNTLYRSWMVSDTPRKQLIFQYVVPQNQRINVLEKSHDSVYSGHLGVQKTQERIKNRFYWPNWLKQTEEYVISCQVCQKIKLSTQNNNAPLKPIIPKYPNDIITMDIMGKLSKSSKGNEYILVIVDHFTKWTQAYALKTITANDIANCLKKWIFQHSIPTQIITDQGTNFQSETLSEVYELLDIYKTRSTAYHPQTDGQTERFMRTLKSMISAYVNEHQNDWDQNLDALIFAYNTALNATTKFTPFELNHGRQARVPLDLYSHEVQIDLELNPQEYAQKLKIILENAYKTVLENTMHTMEKAKTRHDRHVRAAQFQIGDLVSMKIRNATKFGHKWDGPFKILEKQGETDYLIKHVNSKRKRILVHRDKLKKHFNRFNEHTANPNIETVTIKEEPTTQGVDTNNQPTLQTPQTSNTASGIQLSSHPVNNSNNNNNDQAPKKKGRPAKIKESNQQTTIINPQPVISNTTNNYHHNTTNSDNKSHNYLLRPRKNNK